MDVLLLFKAILIAVVEGITEFLPISSTGHMILVGHMIGFTGDFTKLFEIVIQLGAILAIVVLYRKKIFSSLHPKQLIPGKSGFKLWTMLAVAFIPSGLVGLFFNDFIDSKLMYPLPVALSLFVGALWMIYAENKYRGNSKVNHLEDITYKQALVIGCFQILAVIWPGFSRSASTIIGGWIVGLTTVAAAEFSFFLALPTMFLATGYSLLKADIPLGHSEFILLLIGGLVAFMVALIVVQSFIGYLQKKPMRGFAIYRIVVSIVILIAISFNLI